MMTNWAWRGTLRNISKIAGIASAFALMGAGAQPAHAQDAGMPAKSIQLDLTLAPIKQALNYLFQGAGLNYTMDPSVTGYVTVSLHGVSFDTALKSILRASNPPLVATKDPDTGVYFVHPKSTDTTSAPTNASPAPVAAPTSSSDNSGGVSLSQFEVIQLRYADATLLIPLLGQPSLIVPATSAATFGGGTNGSRGGGGNTGNQSSFGGGGSSQQFGGSQTTTAGSSGGFGTSGGF